MAIAFATAMMNSPMPAFSATEVQPIDPAVDQIKNNKNTSAELKAFQLLMLANSFLSDRDAVEVEKAYSGSANQSPDPWFMRHWDRILTDWTYRLSVETPNPKTAKENVLLANAAIQSALIQLEQSSDEFQKLQMYYMAARLFRKSGNQRHASACKSVLNQAIQSCKLKEPINEQQTTAVVSILNVMAYSFIPLRIPDLKRSEASWNKEIEVKPFTQEEFKRAEKLKLAAVAIADCLPAMNDLRRKMHRDLVFWYDRLGKPELAEQQKHTLFGLVGITDESILFPLIGSCGHLIWWTNKKETFGYECGMG